MHKVGFFPHKIENMAVIQNCGLVLLGAHAHGLSWYTKNQTLKVSNLVL